MPSSRNKNSAHRPRHKRPIQKLGVRSVWNGHRPRKVPALSRRRATPQAATTVGQRRRLALERLGVDQHSGTSRAQPSARLSGREPFCAERPPAKGAARRLCPGRATALIDTEALQARADLTGRQSWPPRSGPCAEKARGPDFVPFPARAHLPSSDAPRRGRGANLLRLRASGDVIPVIIDRDDGAVLEACKRLFERGRPRSATTQARGAVLPAGRC